MKFCEIGVYHHDCWFTDAISQFPDLYVKEISGRMHNKNSKKRVIKAVYKVLSAKPELVRSFINRVSLGEQVTQVKPLDDETIRVTWKAPITSYDAVLNSGCAITSSCYSRDGYETYSVFAEKPGNIKKLLYEFGQIGEVKVFSMKNISKDAGKFRLTAKQKQAIVSAISMGYYSWPKKVNLEELAARIGIKRRTLQENLRKAENKILPNLLDELV